MKKGKEKSRRTNGRYRCLSPFILRPDDEGTGVEPFARPPLTAILAFFDALPPSPSFIILACIPSSLDALTFLGQNSVTNLMTYKNANSAQRERYIRPQVPSPSFAVLASSLLCTENNFYSPTNCCQRIFQDRNFVISWHVFA